jgi:processive 1,2-diacylglycerol beta-glucosyltransferase
LNESAIESGAAANSTTPVANSGDGRNCRVLILTSSTGGGHDSRAYSLKTLLEAAGCREVRVEHLLENSSWLPRFGVWVYNTIQKNAPGLHNIYWHIAEVFARFQGKKLSFGRDYYLKLLSAFRPHLIVSMHDCLNRGYFQEAKALLGDNVRTCTYCGEWSGGTGYSRNWMEPSADLFVSRTKDAQDFAVACGMDPARCEVFCNLLPARVFTAPMDDARRGAFRESLGLKPRAFTVLMAAGAVGANNHVRLLDRLVTIPGTQAIAFCGKSQHARARIERWKERHPEYPLFVEGYSTRVHELLQASDCVVSRGGANTTAEALYHGCPILFNRLGGVMPQERLTIRYFLGHGAAREFSSARDFAEIVRELAADRAALERLKTALRGLKSDDRPESFAERLIRLANEAVECEKSARA